MNYVLVNNGAAANNLSNFADTVGIPGVPSTFLPSQAFTGGVASNFGTARRLSAIWRHRDPIWRHGHPHKRQAYDAHRLPGLAAAVNTFYSGNNGRAGTFTYDGRYSGIAEADFLMGLPSIVGGGINGGTWGQRANIFAAFFQDDYRVSQNLTVNLGLRWELHTPWVEVHDRQVNFGLISGVVEQPGKDGNSRALYNTYQGAANFQPRIGFAWTPAGSSFVIRGAYTLSSYLEGTGTNLRLTLNPPYSSEHQLNYTTVQSALPGSTLDDGYIPFGTTTTDPYHNALIRLWDPNVRPAVANQWNFTLRSSLAPRQLCKWDTLDSEPLT